MEIIELCTDLQLDILIGRHQLRVLAVKVRRVLK